MPSRYDTIGTTYAAHRREEPTWAHAIAMALDGARRIVNVGAGSGNYEPRGRQVVAVEPSATMVAHRPARAAPVIRAVSEALPFCDLAFDASLAILTVHHWTDPAAGLAELTRVAPRQVLVTWDPSVSADFWLTRDYLPQVHELEVSLPSLDFALERLDVTAVDALAVPRDCADGFLGARWHDPTAYFDPSLRAAMSGLSLLDQSVVDAALERLRADVDDGTWHERNAALATAPSIDAGYRLVTAGRAPAR
ncbi:MAG TPA: class I SAM-dependent methyltransferase [Acidimicrobiales bacterium]